MTACSRPRCATPGASSPDWIAGRSAQRRIPIINQALVRFRDPRPGATAADHDRHTDQVIERVAAGGEAFFTAATWRGQRVMRISVCNWRTTDADIARAIAAVAASLSR